MNWTQLEIEIVTALTCQVHVLSDSQLHRGWQTEHSKESLALSVRRLNAARLIRSLQWSVVLPVIADAPILTWKPGHSDPDTWPLSRKIRSRWNRAATRVTVHQATELAGRVFGARSGQDSRVIEQRHDLLLAEVFVLYRLRMPELARRWVGENAMPLAERGVKNPDVFLLDEQYRPRRVIESAGSYSQHQVDTFHQYCRQSELPYELW